MLGAGLGRVPLEIAVTLRNRDNSRPARRALHWGDMSTHSMDDVGTATDALREGIHTGRFVPGQRLIEADLMKELGASRSRIREAFRRLEADRLVVIEKNRGATVRRISRKEVSDTLEVLLATALAIADKVTSRADGRAVREAIRRSLHIATRFREQVSEVDQARQYMNENARFWDVLIELCDNQVLSETRLRLETTLFRLGLEGARISAQRSQWITLHEEILETILARKRVRVRQLVAKSVEAVKQAILALPDSAFLSARMSASASRLPRRTPARD
jgi:DNA-binding GntR family transcriptional regulator